MPDFQVAYLPIGVPTFHLETAREEFEKSKDLLQDITGRSAASGRSVASGEPLLPSERLAAPDGPLLSVEQLKAFLDGLEPDILILQNVTFANAAYAGEAAKRFSCPIVLWTLREPAGDGGRLRLNSLTGSYSAANMLRQMGVDDFAYVFGSPGEGQVREALSAAIAAAETGKKLRRAKIASVGHAPEGFGFGKATDAELLRHFHVTLETVEARELMEKARAFSNEDIRECLEDAEQKIRGLDRIPEKNRKDFARLYKAYLEYARENHIAALASRCWPDFFVSYGTPVCAALSLLNDAGIPAACEGDVYGALSMYIGQELSGRPVFFGDPVAADPEENTITYWHCGMAPCLLARDDTKAVAGVHCNRGIGPTLEFGCRPCPHVTVFRVGKKPDGGFRFFLLTGEALDKPRQYSGTSVVVKVDPPVSRVVEESVRAGFEPHFCVIYGDCEKALKRLGGMLGMEVCDYGRGM